MKTVLNILPLILHFNKHLFPVQHKIRLHPSEVYGVCNEKFRQMRVVAARQQESESASSGIYKAVLELFLDRFFLIRSKTKSCEKCLINLKRKAFI